MSDARTAIGRDEQRIKGIHYFLSGVRSYLKGNLLLKKVKERAEQASDIRGGYFSGQIDFATGLEEMLKKLKQGNKQTWAEFLYNYWIFPELYELSPFAGKTIFRVDYSGSKNGPITFARYVEIQSFPRGLTLENTIAKIIQDRGWITYDNDYYLVAIRTIRIDNRKTYVSGVEVYWVWNSVRYSCSDGVFKPLIKPRKADDWTRNFKVDGTPEQRDRYCGFESKQ